MLKTQIFQIQYGKSSTRQKKIFTSDGTLSIIQKNATSYQVAISDDCEKEIYRRQVTDASVYQLGKEMNIGAFDIYIDSEKENKNFPANSVNFVQKKSSEPIPEISRISASQLRPSLPLSRNKPFVSSKISNNTNSINNNIVPNIKTEQTEAPSAAVISSNARSNHPSLPLRFAASSSVIPSLSSSSYRTEAYKANLMMSNPAVDSLSVKSQSQSQSLPTMQANTNVSPIKLHAFHLKELKPHQVEAAEFILRCFQGKRQSPSFQELFYNRNNFDDTDSDHDCDCGVLSTSHGVNGLKRPRTSDDISEGGGGELDWLEIETQTPPSSSSSSFISTSSVAATGTATASVKVYHGAILADEMGLGKTFVSLAALYAVVRHSSSQAQQGSRAVIVCPSALIDNWTREVKRWIGDFLLKPLVVRSGGASSSNSSSKKSSASSAGGGMKSQNDLIIQNFRYGNTPLLIISYDMFRKYASEINQTKRFDAIICDEGHRLKNTLGTKTMASLTQCPARMRLILTGTPMQNDLEELHAMVSFVAPGYLGTLSEFRRLVSTPIARMRSCCDDNSSSSSSGSYDSNTVDSLGCGNTLIDKRVETNKRDAASSPAVDADCGRAQTLRVGEHAMSSLRTLLTGLILRRTQTDILRASLPPRLDVTVYCALSAMQRTQYDEAASSMFATLGIAAKDVRRAVALNQPRPATSTNASAAGNKGKKNNRDYIDSSGRSSVDIDVSASASMSGCSQNSDLCVDDFANELQQDDDSSSVNDSVSGGSSSSSDDDEAEEDRSSTATFKYSTVLPQLQKLRKVCNFYFDDDNGDNEDANVNANDANNEDDSKNKRIHAHIASFKAPSASTSSSGALATFHRLLARKSAGPADSSSLMQHSAKFKVLMELLTCIRATDSSERVVVVSNFTSVLDRVERLSQWRQWRCCRLDGSTPASQRQALVDQFNRPPPPAAAAGGTVNSATTSASRCSDIRSQDSNIGGADTVDVNAPCFLFLLSSKAGGMGLNLIGASRLVMLDCDWNPASDRQAMARIWRPGQRRPVVIYRLIAHRAIEHSILRRQHMKSELVTVMHSPPPHTPSSTTTVNSIEVKQRHPQTQEAEMPVNEASIVADTFVVESDKLFEYETREDEHEENSALGATETAVHFSDTHAADQTKPSAQREQEPAEREYLNVKVWTASSLCRLVYPPASDTAVTGLLSLAAATAAVISADLTDPVVAAAAGRPPLTDQATRLFLSGQVAQQTVTGITYE